MADSDATPPASTAATRKTPTKKPTPKGSLKAYAASPAKGGVVTYSPGKKPMAMSRVMAVSPLDDVTLAQLEREVAASAASRPPRSTPSKTKAKPRPGAGTTKNAAKPKAKAEGEGDESEASTAEGEAKGAEGSAPEHTPKEKLGIWIMNNFKLAEAELTLKDDPVTASLKPAVMRSTLSELGAPLDDDVWSELVGDSDEPLEYDIWLKKMKSTGFSALNKAQNGANRSSTLGRSSTMLSPNAKGKIDFSQVAKIREEVSNKKAEEEKKRQKEGVEFAVQQLERVGYNDMKSETTKKHLEETLMAYSSKSTAKKAIRQVAKKGPATK